ncbi:unnamed protein product [Mytilus coruscus]|uniref:Integrase catalytic domain-containing protein n=1 Tax=Mytilus coruscus TaxID=42192 RepID=A0A6J7ZYH1_MYTCO|nr:unnamed protein product [Mytilus coruscus]
MAKVEMSKSSNITKNLRRYETELVKKKRLDQAIELDIIANYGRANVIYAKGGFRSALWEYRTDLKLIIDEYRNKLETFGKFIEGRDIYNTLQLSEDDAKKLSVNFEKCLAYVQTKQNSLLAMCKFRHETQSSDTVEQFINRLKLIAKDCHFKDTDEMIRDSLIFGTSSPKMKEKLFNEGDALTLGKAIQIAQAFEYSQGQLKEMKNYESSTVVHEVNLPRHSQYNSASSRKNRVRRLIKQGRVQLTKIEFKSNPIVILYSKDVEIVGVDNPNKKNVRRRERGATVAKNRIILCKYADPNKEVHKLHGTISKSVINKLKGAFSRLGIPETVVSDNSPQYSFQEFSEFAKKWDFKYVTCTPSPHYPISNWLAEKTVKTVKNMFNKCKKDGKDPYVALLEYRTTPLDIGYTPPQLLMCGKLKSVLPSTLEGPKPKTPLYNEVHSKIGCKKSYQKKYFDRDSKPFKFRRFCQIKGK